MRILNFRVSFKKFLFCLVLSLLLIFSSVNAFALDHYDFTYPDRSSFMAAGWDFLAVTPSGGMRNTEQTTGALVSYDQTAHPGILRIPADTGDLWAGLNNTRNTLFRNLPFNWMSIRLKLAFAPTQNYQQAGLLAYQDDNNYVQVTRIYEGGNRVTFAREVGGSPSNLNSVSQTATTNLYLRLDRDPATEKINSYYSLNGTSWTSLGSVTQSLSNPRLAIVVGASPGGFPNADLAWVEVDAGGAIPETSLSLFPNNLVFSGVQGMTNPQSQIVNILHKGPSLLSWEQSDNSPWLSVTPANGTTPGSLTVSVDTNGLAPGVYSGTITVTAVSANNSPQIVNVTLIVNPNVPVKVSTWKNGHKGALSVSTDDGNSSCFNELSRNGFNGSYITNGTVPPYFYVSYYNSGMELGAHLADHVCVDVIDEVLRYQEIEPNIQGICTNTPEPCEDVITLAWPCGFTNVHEQAVASEYFLSARGYNFNQLEDTTPANFLNLKCFNSHEHTPYPPSDLKTVVDTAELQGKWANLVFHTSCNDNGAIDYAATKDIWVAPIGTVIKYILQRDRFILSNYQENSDQIVFSFSRLPIPSSPIRSFETAFGPNDFITIQVDVDDARQIASVQLNGVTHPYELKTINENKILFLDTSIDATPKTIRILYGSDVPPIIALNPTSLTFTVVQGANPANKTIALSNSGGGIMSWTATADGTAPAWLSVSPTSGAGGATLTVSVNSAGLSPGTYTKIIIVAAPGATNTPQIVNITLTVNPVPPPTISLNPSSLTFAAMEGTNPANQTIALSNSGGGTMNWTATADGTAPAWLSVSPTSGVGNAILTVSVNSAGLSPGTYSKAITVAAPSATNTPQTVNVTLTVTPVGTGHYDFNYPDQASLIAAGWDFLAVTPSGGVRDTEQKTGAVVSYDQVAHPGVLRIPCDAGDLWAGLNNTRNTIFRNLPSNWTSIRLKLSFAPTQNYQQAGLLVYQNDNNYVQVTRIYESGNRVTFAREVNGSPSNLNSISETATSNMYLRLDRNLNTEAISAYYSRDGANWTSLGSVTQSISNPRLAIVVGASPGGFPNADLSWAEVITGIIPPTILLSPKTLTFTAIEGTNPANQTIALSNSGGGTLNWTATADGTAPAWFSVSPTSGVGNAILTVSVNSAGLSQGTYSKTITLAAPSATNTPQMVNVALTVTSASPVIALNPTLLNFSAVEGTNPANQTIALSNSGGGTLTWTATADGTAPAWFSVSPTSGVGNAILTVSVNSAGLSPGTYSKAITVAAPGATNTPQTVNVNLTVNPAGTGHYDFTYSDRTSLLAAGWDFFAVTPSGGVRDTEQRTGTVVSYDQVAHPGILRIPCDAGDLWAGLNNTRNTLFRNLFSNWTSIRLKLAFAPTQNYQQAGLVAYQDDNNYVQVTRIYNGGNRLTFAKEVGGSASVVNSVSLTATSNLYFRLDRDPATQSITAYYSLDGATWTSRGSVTQSLTNPRLAIVVGASPGGFPNADLSWAEVILSP